MAILLGATNMAFRPHLWIIASALSLICGLLFLTVVFSPFNPLSDIWYIVDNGTRSWTRVDRAMQKSGYVRDETRPGMVIVLPESRASDLTDSFANYSKSLECDESSLALHEPFHPLCSSRDELLQAMASGGRRGIDAPYSPRGCDMRWFSTNEVCSILSRYVPRLLLCRNR